MAEDILKNGMNVPFIMDRIKTFKKIMEKSESNRVVILTNHYQIVVNVYECDECNKDEYINVLKEFYKTHLKLKDMNIYSYSIVTHTYSIDEIVANILSSVQRFNFNEELYKRYTDRIELVCKALQDKSDTFKCLYPHV